MEAYPALHTPSGQTVALKLKFEVNLKECLATPATLSAWPQRRAQTLCGGKGNGVMLLTNRGRKGGPLQTPKNSSEEHYKKRPLYQPAT